MQLRRFFVFIAVANGKIFDADTMDEVWPKAKPRGTLWPLAPRNGRR